MSVYYCAKHPDVRCEEIPRYDGSTVISCPECHEQKVIVKEGPEE